MTLAPSLTAACQASSDLSLDGSGPGEVVGKSGKKGEEQQEKEAGGEEEKGIEGEGENVYINLKVQVVFRCCTVSVCSFLCVGVFFFVFFNEMFD